MELSAVLQNDPRLRQPCADLTKSQLASKPQQAEISALWAYVQKRGLKTLGQRRRPRTRPGTVGLSMNQVGILKRICIVDLSIGKRGYNDLHVLVNPEIIWKSKTSVERIEGCVNFTTIWGKTIRSRTVKVKALDRSGNELTMKLTGWPAILLQHEIDHLNGRLFIDRLVDPSRADLVPENEFADYRKNKSAWAKTIDVRADIVADTTAK